MPKYLGKPSSKQKKAKPPLEKKKGKLQPPAIEVVSPFITDFDALLAGLEVECAVGDLAALARALEILTFSPKPAPVWLIPPLAKIVKDRLDNTVVGKGPRATPRKILDLNWIDFRRFAIVRKLIADGKILKKQAYALAKDDLVAAGVYAEPRKIQESCRRTIALLKKPSFSPARDFPVEPEVFFELLGVDVQE